MSTSVAHPPSFPRPRLWLRGRVWLHRHALDRSLAASESPSASPELTYRAEQLRSFRCRRSFATGIKRILDAAEEPPRPFTAAVPVRRREILEARDDLIELGDLLWFEANLHVRGLALMERFLTSGDSPLFHPNPEETLEQTVRRIRAALLLR